MGEYSHFQYGGRGEGPLSRVTLSTIGHESDICNVNQLHFFFFATTTNLMFINDCLQNGAKPISCE